MLEYPKRDCRLRRTIERLWEVAPDLQIVICPAYSDYDHEPQLLTPCDI
jgi:hypothetical protein